MREKDQAEFQKNIFKINGKPLIAHSIIQAKTAGIFDEIAVSSDSDEILKLLKHGGQLLRLKDQKNYQCLYLQNYQQYNIVFTK